MPKVSVIVPVYNVERFLPKCIDSILNQTFRDIELVLVDDGSSDGSGTICDAYAQKDNRVNVIHKKNAGTSAARNTGIESAQGSYIMFVDSDDYLDSAMLEDLLLYDGSDMILSGIRYVNTQGEFIKEYNASVMDKIALVDFVQNDYVALDGNFVLGGPVNKLYAREVIHSNSIRFCEDISICEDGLFVVQVLDKCKTVSSVPKAYYNYVQYGEGTLMYKYNENAIEACEMFYLAKCDLLRHYGVSDASVYHTVGEASFGQFSAFLFQIYTRSGLSNLEKYRKVKAALSNSSFIVLTKASRRRNLNTMLLKLSVLTKSFFLLHMVCSIRFCRK